MQIITMVKFQSVREIEGWKTEEICKEFKTTSSNLWGDAAPCDVTTQEISELMDHRISLKSRLKIRLHVMFCKLCRGYQSQLRTMHTLFEEHLQKEEENRLPKGSTLSPEARGRSLPKSPLTIINA